MAATAAPDVSPERTADRQRNRQRWKLILFAAAGFAGMNRRIRNRIAMNATMPSSSSMTMLPNSAPRPRWLIKAAMPLSPCRTSSNAG